MKKYYRASYTVEAAVIVPFFLLIMVATIQIAIDYHEEIEQVAKNQEEREEFSAVRVFYRIENGKELWEKIFEEGG